MRNYLRLAFASLALASGGSSSNAIDLFPSSDAEIGAVSWTGFIFNPDAGYETLKFSGPAGRILKDASGIRVGAELGYDYQIGSFVVGAAGDLAKTWIDGGRERGSADAVGSRFDVFGTARGRLGYTYGRFLAYGTGGLAFGRLRLDDATTGLSEAKTLTGWAGGGGVEYVYRKDITLRAQYLHIDLGTETYGSLPARFNNVNPTMDIVGLGLITRF